MSIMENKLKCLVMILYVIAVLTSSESSNQIYLVDIETVTANLLQCNMHCVAREDCQAFTLHKLDKNDKYSSPNLCKLHRLFSSEDHRENISIPEEGDITMTMTRGPILLANIVEHSQLIPIEVETISETTTTIETTTVTEPSTVPPSKSINMPTNNNLRSYAIDTLNDDKYIFFYSGGQKNLFSVVDKDNIQETLQTKEVSQVFENFNGKSVYSAFTIDGIMYLLCETTWLKFKIELTSDGLLSKGTKVAGGITNPILKLKSIMSSTIIGNDTLLLRYNDASLDCYHKDVLSTNQTSLPPPAEECKTIIDFVKKDPILSDNTSILGNSSSTLRLLISPKLYRMVSTN